MNLQSTIDLYAGGPGSGCHGDNCGRHPGHGTFGKSREVKDTAMGTYPHKFLANVRVWKGTGHRDIGGRFVRTNVEMYVQPAEDRGPLFSKPTTFVVKEYHTGEGDSLEHRGMLNSKEFTSIGDAHKYLESYYGIKEKPFPSSRSLHRSKPKGAGWNYSRFRE